MRKEALIGISVFLVMVSGSATVLNSFGVISGEANVEGPTFYASSNDKLELENTDNYTYAVDEDSGTTSWSFVYGFGQTVEWYDSNFDISVEAKSEREDGSITVNWKYDDTEICGNTKDLSNVEDTYTVLEFECDMDAQSLDSFELVLDVNIESDDDNGEVSVRRHEDTFVKVNAQ